MTAKILILSVDPIACVGHGICAELFPEWIRLDDWGYPILRPGPIPPEMLRQARWTVSNCPALALRIDSVATVTRQPGPVGEKGDSYDQSSGLSSTK